MIESYHRDYIWLLKKRKTIALAFVVVLNGTLTQCDERVQQT